MGRPMETTYNEVKHCAVFLSCISRPWVLIYLIRGLV